METYKTAIPEITLKYKTGEQKKIKIGSPRDTYNILKILYDEDIVELLEICIIIFLNRANATIGWMKVSQGGLTSTVIDPRLILGTALKCAASGIIVSHNHPCKQLNPSIADFSETDKLKKACELFDITLFDHIIYTPDGYYSFADHKKI